MKKILITGKNSYVGVSFKKWIVTNYPKDFEIDSVSVRDSEWEKKDFSQYDVVIHVAAIVHNKGYKNNKSIYFHINKDLAIEVAQKAKVSGVTHFIFFSTMSVYGNNGVLNVKNIINIKTPEKPNTLYGESKLEAEKELKKLAAKDFNILILRPPMIYGENSPGNYSYLEKIASTIPVFPMVNNERSMLHIDVLCEYLKEAIDKETHGLHFPQDEEYKNTSLLVKQIASSKGKNIYLSKTIGDLVVLLGNKSKLINKIFGNLVYEKNN